MRFLSDRALFGTGISIFGQLLDPSPGTKGAAPVNNKSSDITLQFSVIMSRHRDH